MRSKRTIRTSPRLRKKHHPKALQVSCTFCGGENALSEHVQSSYTLCSGQNALSKDILLKTDTPNLNEPLTRFAVVEPNSPIFYTSCRGQNALSEVPQSSYTLAEVKTSYPIHSKLTTRIAVAHSNPLQPYSTFCG